MYVVSLYILGMILLSLWNKNIRKYLKYLKWSRYALFPRGIKIIIIYIGIICWLVYGGRLEMKVHRQRVVGVKNSRLIQTFAVANIMNPSLIVCICKIRLEYLRCCQLFDQPSSIILIWLINITSQHSHSTWSDRGLAGGLRLTKQIWFHLSFYFKLKLYLQKFPISL